ncbi:MAG TPA: hypothetical protein VMD47_09605 [Candidatus Acidoferrales bacterium]|nr:hypothetical protein [Candidatus Acidoferrales bacterium]
MNSRVWIILGTVAALAACGGGGGGSTGGGGGGVTPPVGSTSSPSTQPSSSASPSITGAVAINGSALSNATVTFTCGCSAQAGEISTNASGDYTIGASAQAIPAAPTPTYTSVPGRNYMIIGYVSGGTQAWTMEYLGDTQAYDLNLSSSPNNLSTNTTDTASTAAALYIYYESQNDSDQSFDLWNFNTIASWAQHLRAGSGLSAHESTFLSDITSAQGAGQSLFPTIPAWDPQSGASANTTIRGDIQAIAGDGVSVDPLLPTPCPGEGACTGTPTP